MLKKQHAHLAPLSLVLVLGIVLAACSAGSSPTPSNTPAPTEPFIPTDTSTPADTPAPAEPLSAPLIGKWDGTDVELGALIIEFKSDGVYEATASGGQTFALTYEMVDDDTFILTDPSGLVPSTVDFVRSGDTLTMTMDGSTLELRKLP
jgi:hypothetical protein